jgi:MOSC domain-containing protein YiiM
VREQIVAHVVSIVYRPEKTRRPRDRYERAAAERVLLVERQGIEGDMKGSKTKRQLNVMHAEVVAELAAEGFQAGPGELGEQVVVAGVDRDPMVAGARLRIGAAVIEVVEPRTGCARFEMIQGRSRKEVKGRLGVIARVIEGGEVAVGDPVEVLPPD